jgi:hypothetical protein
MEIELSADGLGIGVDVDERGPVKAVAGDKLVA